MLRDLSYGLAMLVVMMLVLMYPASWKATNNPELGKVIRLK